MVGLSVSKSLLSKYMFSRENAITKNDTPIVNKTDIRIQLYRYVELKHDVHKINYNAEKIMKLGR